MYQYTRVSKLRITTEIYYPFTGFLFALAIICCLQLTAAARPDDARIGDPCTELSFAKTNFFNIGSTESDFVKAVDVNNDGISDVLINLLDLGQISVQLGDGEGGLLSANNFNTGGFPSDFEVVDVNRDGEPDILAVNETAGRIALMLGDGIGNFTLAGSINVGPNPKLIEVGNFDREPYLDFVVAYANSIKVYSGNRDLTFTEKGSIQTPFSPDELEATKLNGDEITDLVGQYFDGGAEKIQTYLGQVNGGLTLSSTVGDINAETIAAGDVNNDGNGDFITAERFNSDYTIYTFLGNGNGTFQNRITSNASSLFGLKLFDMNLDGNLDAVTSGGAVMLGNGTGSFTVLQTAAASNFAQTVGFGDFNSDGLPDIAFTNQNRTGIYLNRGDGGFRNVTEVGVNEFQLNRPTDPATADFNMDGKDDFVVLNFQNNTAFVYVQTANGRFVPTPANGLQVGGGFNVSPYSVTIADFNNDNIPDFAVTDSFARQIVIFTGNGDATFVRTQFTNNDQFAYTPRFIRTGKFNNDNFTDIIVTNNGGSYIVYLNDGMGGFTRLTPVSIGSSTQLRLVAIGDVTNDGIQDIITGKIDSGSLSFLLGNGDGTFVTNVTPLNGVGALAAIILEDLNGDGNLDLIVGGDRIVVSFGVGNGGFFNAVTYDYEGNINDLEFFDFDGDGIKDLVASGGPFPFGAIFVLRGVGSGQYEQPYALNQASYPQGITPGDFNGDGKTDLVVYSGFVVKTLFNDTNSLPCVGVSDAQANEQPGGSTVTFNISLSRTSVDPISVSYKSVGRTSQSGVDFVPATGTAMFPPGTISQPVVVNVNDDQLDEDDEILTLTLTNATNAKILDSVGVGTIVDNDAPPTLQVPSFAGVVEGNAGSSVGFGIGVPLTTASGRKIRVHIATQDVTAIGGQDYGPFSEFLYYEPGSTFAGIILTPIADRRPESDEIFNINFTDPVHVVLSNSQLPVTIINDDFSPFDFDRDGKTDASIFRPAPGEWWYRKSSDGGNGALQFGQSTDNLTPADFTGDGITDIAFWRESTGEWFVLRSEDFSFYSVPFGTSGDIPAPGDFDGDGSADLAVFRPSTATWYINNSSGGTSIIGFGASGDKPVIADYDGDGNDDIAIYRPSVSEWWINGSLSGISAVQFGASGDQTVPGDYTGDGKADIAFYRPTSGEWYILRSNDRSFYSFPFGTIGDIPSPGDYDGDGVFDAAVFRPSNSTWYINGSQSGTQFIGFGVGGDIPLPGLYIRQ